MNGKTREELEARKIIRDELEDRSITYKNLSRLLESQGIYENELQLRSKINRGKFSFTFFIQVMRAIGASHLAIRANSHLGFEVARMETKKDSSS